jgi:hypothetical protein
MPGKIISGGQTGVDRRALDACLLTKFECGRWCPTDRRAEYGITDSIYPLEETVNWLKTNKIKFSILQAQKK